MIKAILFDLDGVLVEAKHLHYIALNEALDMYGYKITRLEHLTMYDGRSTRKKLDMLTEQKNLPRKYHDSIWKRKQCLTEELANKYIRPTKHITSMIQKLHNEGYVIGLCSNAILTTCKLFLELTRLKEYFSIVLSNEDVSKTKPDPEIYLKAMKLLGVSKKETIIVEDSPVGLQSAYNSGAFVCPVKNTNTCTYNKIRQKLNEVSNDNINSPDGGKRKTI